MRRRKAEIPVPFELPSQTGWQMSPASFDGDLPGWAERRAGAIWIDTDSEALLALAWASAAYDVIRRPPTPPPARSDDEADRRLRMFWPDWIRILCHLALVAPVRLEKPATALANSSTGPNARREALGKILGLWGDRHPSELRAIASRLSSLGGAGGVDIPDGPVPDVLDQIVDDGWSQFDALSSALTWWPEISTSAFPVFFESRWVIWPSPGPSRLQFRLNPAPAEAETPAPGRIPGPGRPGARGPVPLRARLRPGPSEGPGLGAGRLP